MKTHPAVDVLWCPNARQGRSNGWSFPPAVEKQLRADCEGKSVLHLFGGRSRFGLRVDVDAIVRPDVIGDAWLPPFKSESFDVVILDPPYPPYTHINAQMKTALFAGAAAIARERVIWFSTIWASNAGGLAMERGWLVRVGDSCHCRCLQYFSIARPKLPARRYFARGPAMKYNRWIAQPQAFAFGGGQ